MDNLQKPSPTPDLNREPPDDFDHLQPTRLNECATSHISWGFIRKPTMLICVCGAQDALDSVEFVTGPENSTWGTVRSIMGRSQPWQLPYLAIGNEVIPIHHCP